tara:strand:- start:237 stop:452 length:216 start_codon:yes stop_codon:yes gene_type:complete
MLQGIYHVAEWFATLLVNNITQHTTSRGRGKYASLPHGAAAVDVSRPFSSEVSVEIYQQSKFVIAYLAKTA